MELEVYIAPFEELYEKVNQVAPEKLDVFALVESLGLGVSLQVILVFNQPEDYFLDYVEASTVDELKKERAEAVVTEEDFVEFGKHRWKLAAVLHYLGLSGDLIHQAGRASNVAEI